MRKYLPGVYFLALILIALDTHGQKLNFYGDPDIYLPGVVSTKNSEVKIAFNKSGDKILWGGIDWIIGKKDQDIWQSDLKDGKWTNPVRVSFDSDSNDFDPSFSPDGKSVYFFSNRTGGFGGDDIYVVSYNQSTRLFGEPVNLGSVINTAGNEWAPTLDKTGSYLLFSSGGHGGFGGQDLFTSIKSDTGFLTPVNLGPVINGPTDDFDAVLLPEDVLIFTSTKGSDSTVGLYCAVRKNGLFEHAERLPDKINSLDYWTLGPSCDLHKPGYLYFSSHLKNNEGRTDIYSIKYKIE